MNQPATVDTKDDQAFQGEQPWGMPSDLAIDQALSQDPRFWAPLGPDAWSRPLHINTSLGYYVHLLRVTRSGILQRHRHSGPVHAYVIKGSWFYPEHDWIAKEGSYIFEPPGETHTLTVSDDCEEMITLFTVFGALMYVDQQGNSTGYDDVFTRIERYRKHFEEVGLGADYVKTFMR
ncbi:MAG: 2,4'-dihydroxyacetophenone dioxygenase family protein [Granulosicoccus sp.]|nr:2,4'-dihydroxyacetophenone dioxygenase family protein [Granulosicoccus sp.]